MYIFSFRFIHSARASQAQILPRVFVLLRGGVIYRIAHRVSHHARPFAPRRVHLSRSFIRAFSSSAVRRTVSVIRVIHGRLHLRAQLHLCDASRRHDASSSVRVRAFDAVIARPTARLSSNQSESKSHRIHRVRDSSVTNEIRRAHRRRAIARSPTPRPRRRRRANRRARPSRPWPSTSADERAPRANAPPPPTHIYTTHVSHQRTHNLIAIQTPPL